MVHVSVPRLEDRSWPVPCLFPLAHAPIMAGSIYGLTSRGRQRVESEEAAHVCPQRPHRQFSSTKTSQPHIDQNICLPNRIFREIALSGVHLLTLKTQRALGPSKPQVLFKIIQSQLVCSFSKAVFFRESVVAVCCKIYFNVQWFPQVFNYLTYSSYIDYHECPLPHEVICVYLSIAGIDRGLISLEIKLHSLWVYWMGNYLLLMIPLPSKHNTLPCS